MTGDKLNPVPPGWGNDPLTEFFDAARSNAYASFHLLADYRRRAVALDRAYLSLLTDFHDPEHPIGAALALRCHSALRAAAQLAFAGQVPEAFAVLRLALELAMYAHHASASDERSLIWLNRNESSDARKRCISEFTPRVILAEIRARNSSTGDVAGNLYELAIDYGAHPNVAGVLTSMIHEEGEEVDTFSFAYLSGDPVALPFVIRSWCQVAVSCLDVFQLVFPKRFESLQLGEQVDASREGL